VYKRLESLTSGGDLEAFSSIEKLARQGRIYHRCCVRIIVLGLRAEWLLFREVLQHEVSARAVGHDIVLSMNAGEGVVLYLSTKSGALLFQIQARTHLYLVLRKIRNCRSEEDVWF
jgi:hypothetical protein